MERVSRPIRWVRRARPRSRHDLRGRPPPQRASEAPENALDPVLPSAASRGRIYVLYTEIRPRLSEPGQSGHLYRSRSIRGRPGDEPGLSVQVGGGDTPGVQRERAVER